MAEEEGTRGEREGEAKREGERENQPHCRRILSSLITTGQERGYRQDTRPRPDTVFPESG
jgi:hypothetical protein